MEPSEVATVNVLSALALNGSSIIYFRKQRIKGTGSIPSKDPILIALGYFTQSRTGWPFFKSSFWTWKTVVLASSKFSNVLFCYKYSLFNCVGKFSLTFFL